MSEQRLGALSPNAMIDYLNIVNAELQRKLAIAVKALDDIALESDSEWRIDVSSYYYKSRLEISRVVARQALREISMQDNAQNMSIIEHGKEGEG